jgi:hypothetical protein
MADIDEAEGQERSCRSNAGHSFGPNQYEIDTGNALICPTVSSHA